MAELRSLCFPSNTSISLLEHPSLSSLPPLCNLSLSSPQFKPTSLSLRRATRFRPISCSSSTLAAETPPLASQENDFSDTRLVAQNVPWTSTAADIRALFEKHGTVLDIEFSMHSKTRNRGIVFVEMGSAEEAAEALTKLEAYEYEGRSLKLNYAKPKKKKVPPPVQPKPDVLYNLFVANLSFEARAKDLKEFFQSGGAKVFSAEVIFNDNPRKSAGYGFVSFKTKKEADEILLTFQGKELMGRPIRLARSKRFVKLETEVDSKSEDGQDTSANSSHNSEQPETVDSL